MELVQRTVKAVTSPQLFGDERDDVVCHLNQLLAFSGVGKGYFYPNMPPAEFNKEGPYFGFKVN